MTEDIDNKEFKRRLDILFPNGYDGEDMMATVMDIIYFVEKEK